MGLRHVENGLIALLPGSARIMLGLADSNEPSQVSLQDALWRRPIALFATAALRRTLGQVTLPKEVERVFGRCAPYDPSRSSNKQKSKLFCLLSSLRYLDVENDKSCVSH